ncbi:MAG: alpha-L-fucosidase [Prevotellaceae bacterium]|jgi:alpha-L-fucosidase|nr:alpha-L-fucosidase [Prevotellaceae bacterium]
MKKFLLVFLLFGIAATITAQTVPSVEQVRQDRARGVTLPENDFHYKVVKDYVEEEPDADYIHASETAHEAFRDIKFSIRIHWGVYSKWGIEASIPYLAMSKEKKMEYNELYKTFNPEGFNADEWMSFFKRCGMQAFAFTSKHCDGFSMFHTKTRVQRRVNYLNTENHPIESCNLAYSIEESPFKRDIVKELCDAARKNDVKINFYYSHPDWYDADFRPYCGHPIAIPDEKINPKDYPPAWGHTVSASDPTPEEQSAMITRHREQLRELLSNYGAIDMICLDMWLGKPVWEETKKTVKMMRQLQPDVMIRARGIGNYGDYYQPEEFVPEGKENTNMPWMSICLLGKSFAYDPVAEHYKGTQWVVNHLVDCVAKGGSFMVCIGPDANGKFHPEAVRQLEAVGEWLKVNGEGIYETRARDVWKSGDIRFTRSKDNKQVYAFVEKFPEKELIIPSVTPKKKSKVRLLGYSKPLKWQSTGDGGIKVEIPEALQSPENRPCEYAWAFKIEN